MWMEKTCKAIAFLQQQQQNNHLNTQKLNSGNGQLNIETNVLSLQLVNLFACWSPVNVFYCLALSRINRQTRFVYFKFTFHRDRMLKAFQIILGNTRDNWSFRKFRTIDRVRHFKNELCAAIYWTSQTFETNKKKKEKINLIKLRSKRKCV